MFNSEEATVFERGLHQLGLEHPQGGCTLRAVGSSVDRSCMRTARIDPRLLDLGKTAGMEVRRLIETHHLAKMGEGKQLCRAEAVRLEAAGL